MRKKTSFAIPLLISLFLLLQPNLAGAITVSELQAQIEELQNQIAQLQEQLQQLDEAGTDIGQSWCYDFNNSITFGSGSGDVTALQTALQKEGLYTRTITGSFDAKTAESVTWFQEKYQAEVLSPWGLTKGTGLAGKTTTAKLNQLYGCTIQPGSSSQSSGCQNFWWYDEGSNRYCQERQFCGAYMYLGLHTFTTEETCKTSLRLEGTATSTPPCTSCGDVDLDGDVDLIDASLISNYAAKTVDLSEGQKFRADVNGDGKVNVVDATTITQYVEGTISSFLVCKAGQGSSDDSSGGKTADNITLPEELQGFVDSLLKANPSAKEYIDKISYAFRDAYADLYNGTIYNGDPENTTAYRHALGMIAVLDSYNIVKEAGYSRSFTEFTCNSCFGYSYIKSPIYKMISGTPVAVPGAKVYDPVTKQWYVWDEWGVSARLATELEAKAYEWINNEVTEAGDGYLNNIATAEMHIRERDQWIETARERIEIIESGGAYSEMWGDVEYLQNRIDRWQNEINDYFGVIDLNEKKLEEEIGDLPPDWKDVSGDNDDSGGLPATPEDTGGTASQEYRNYWDSVLSVGDFDPNFDWQEYYSWNPEVQTGKPGGYNDDSGGLPATPEDTGDIVTQGYKDYWNSVQTIDDYDWNSEQDTENQRTNSCPSCKVNYPDPEDSEGEEEEEEEEEDSEWEEDWGTDEYWEWTFKNIEGKLAAISGAIIRLAEGIKELLNR